jgi:YVTN family beta-propeller protein
MAFLLPFTASLLAAAAVCCAADLPARALLVLNKEEATLAIVDASSGKVIGRIPTGENPHEVEVSLDGKLAFVTNYGSRTPGHTLSVIDLVTQKERHRVELAPLSKPHGITVSQGKVWFSAEANKAIGSYDPVSNRVDGIVGTGQSGSHMVLTSKDDKYFFTTNMGSNTVSIFERTAEAANWKHTVLAVGQGPEALDLTPDGRELWVAHSRDGGVSVIDIEGGKVASTIDVGTKRSNRLKFTPDGKYVLISDLAGGELVVLDRASRKQVKRMQLGKSPEGIFMEPGGARAFIAVAGDNHIAVLDLKTLELTGKFETGQGPDGMAWAGGTSK